MDVPVPVSWSDRGDEPPSAEVVETPAQGDSSQSGTQADTRADTAATAPVERPQRLLCDMFGFQCQHEDCVDARRIALVMDVPAQALPTRRHKKVKKAAAIAKTTPEKLIRVRCANPSAAAKRTANIATDGQ